MTGVNRELVGSGKLRNRICGLGRILAGRFARYSGWMSLLIIAAKRA
jgi:hypothetical protein